MDAFGWFQLVMACTGVVAWGGALLMGGLLLWDRWAAKRRRERADELWRKRSEAAAWAAEVRKKAELELARRHWRGN
jgi:Tfp pilus assembly protein PilN